MEIYFRSLEITDANFINKLRLNEDIENKIGGNKRFVSLEREKKWIEDIILTDNKNYFYVAICKLVDGEIIGYTSVSEIDHVNKSCCWSGIKINPKYNGKGVGTKTGKLILKYIFNELGMNRCTALILEEHVVIKKLIENIGFKVEGLRRHSIFKNGEYKNQYDLSILREDYLKYN